MTTADFERPEPCLFTSKKEAVQPPQLNEVSVIRDPESWIELSDHIMEACHCELSSYILIHAAVYGNFTIDNKKIDWTAFAVQKLEVAGLPGFFQVFRLKSGSGRELLVFGRDTGFTRAEGAGHNPPPGGFESYIDAFFRLADSLLEEKEKLSKLLNRS